MGSTDHDRSFLSIAKVVAAFKSSKFVMSVFWLMVSAQWFGLALLQVVVLDRSTTVDSSTVTKIVVGGPLLIPERGGQSDRPRDFIRYSYKIRDFEQPRLLC